jgi:hypothetical protein
MTDVDVEVVKRADRVVRPYGRKTKCRRPKDAPTIEQEEILVHCVVCPPGVPQDDRFQQYKTEEWMQRGRTESSLQYYRYVFHPSVPAGHLPSSGGNPTNTIIA